MLKIIITGAAGRMGRRLVANIAADPELELAGATERPDCSLIGADAGEVAGVGNLGVKIVSSLEEAFANGADAIIDFCKLKTHGMMGMSAAAKNMFGIIPGTFKPEYHFRYPDHKDFAKMLVDLFADLMEFLPIQGE